MVVYKSGLTASLAVRLIGLWLFFARQKVIHRVRDEIAKFVVKRKGKTISTGNLCLRGLRKKFTSCAVEKGNQTV